MAKKKLHVSFLWNLLDSLLIALAKPLLDEQRHHMQLGQTLQKRQSVD
jgi:hypothetical protein